MLFEATRGTQFSNSSKKRLLLLPSEIGSNSAFVCLVNRTGRERGHRNSNIINKFSFRSKKLPTPNSTRPFPGKRTRSLFECTPTGWERWIPWDWPTVSNLIPDIFNKLFNKIFLFEWQLECCWSGWYCLQGAFMLFGRVNWQWLCGEW